MTTDGVTAFIGTLCKNRIPFKENEPLSAHSTFRIGGAARVFVTPRSEAELALALTCADENRIRTFIAGRGSNIVYPDAGFNGAVISTLSMSDHVVDGCIITAGAGVSLTELANTAAKSELTRMEFAYGIPGSLGGAVFMNAGAYGGEMSGIITKSRYYDRKNGEFSEITGDAHEFGYRESIYRLNPDWVIISAEMTLAEGDRSKIEATMADYMNRRKEKQPLEYPSAGSAFKRYPGRYTAEMIDKAGLKGFTVGGAQVSEKHAGFIINIGGATAADVRELSELIKARIRDIHGIEIESEIIFVE